MKTKTATASETAAGLLALVLAAAACGTAAGGPAPASVPPAAPAESSRPRVVEAAPADTGRRANPADVRFMRGMIHHHAQALEMTALVPARSARADLRLLAERIEVSQRDEIAILERWLRERGEAVPGPDAHHAPHGAAGRDTLMPGMLTPDEMARLAAATGAEFDRLFLELMIRHHEGALTMVAQLFASPGAGQETQIFQIASDVDADQRAEIERMRRLQGGPLPGAP